VRSVPSSSEDRVPVGAAAVDARQFEELVAPHVTVLTAIATRLVGTDDAGDVVQEALLRAWRRWSTFDPDRGTVRAWLAAIVVDRARRHRRGRMRGPVVVAGPNDQPVTGLERDDRLMVEEVIRSLPRRQREVTVLFYLADLSVEQTASALGLRAGSVKAHLAAARAALKTKMENS
jgi:RNA polymerase sigma-70 factor (ECF subfamily)